MQELKTIRGRTVTIPITMRMKAPIYSRVLAALERGEEANLSRFIEKAVLKVLDEPKREVEDATAVN